MVPCATRTEYDEAARMAVTGWQVTRTAGRVVAGLTGMLGLYRYSRKLSHDRLRRFVDGAVVGRSLQRAQAQLDEVRQFAQEAA